MKLAICLIGEDSLALASLKQQLEREPSVSVEPRVYGYGEAFEALKTRTGPIVAVVDINLDPERAFAVAEQMKLRLANVRLVMTSPTGAPDTILRAMRSTNDTAPNKSLLTVRYSPRTRTISKTITSGFGVRIRASESPRSAAAARRAFMIIFATSRAAAK